MLHLWYLLLVLISGPIVHRLVPVSRKFLFAVETQTGSGFCESDWCILGNKVTFLRKVRNLMEKENKSTTSDLFCIFYSTILRTKVILWHKNSEFWELKFWFFFFNSDFWEKKVRIVKKHFFNCWSSCADCENRLECNWVFLKWLFSTFTGVKIWDVAPRRRCEEKLVLNGDKPGSNQISVCCEHTTRRCEQIKRKCSPLIRPRRHSIDGEQPSARRSAGFLKQQNQRSHRV